MPQDVRDLAAFYKTPLGQLAHRAIAREIHNLWPEVQTSPFGHGRPFSRMELEGLLKDGLFEPGRWHRALYAPPFKMVTRSGTGWEKVGSRLFSGVGGVHVVEAAKSLYAAAMP